VSIIITGVIFIFIGVNAADNHSANDSVTGPALLGSNADAGVNIDPHDELEKPVDPATTAESGLLSKAEPSEAKNIVSTKRPLDRSSDAPGCTLALLIIGVFGYIWVNTDKRLRNHQSDKLLINHTPTSLNPQTGGAFFVRHGDEG
jgi:hypothetical protein